MTGDRILDEVAAAFDEVRRLEPDPTGRLDAVYALSARRTAWVRRTMAVALVLATVGIASAVSVDDDPAGTSLRTSAGDRSAAVIPPTTTSTTTLGIDIPIDELRPVEPQVETVNSPSSPRTSVLDNPQTASPPAPTTTIAGVTTTTTWVRLMNTDVRPPKAYVHAGGRAETEAETGTYCWTDETGGGCSDRFSDDYPDAPWVEASPGEKLVIRWDSDDVPSARVSTHRPGTASDERAWVVCGNRNPCTVDTPIVPGEYEVAIESSWKQGDADYGVRLRVF